MNTNAAPAYDSHFVHATVYGGGALVCGERTNYGNPMTNSIIAGVEAREVGPYGVDFTLEHDLFWANGFPAPPGGDDVEDPQFVDAGRGDFHLTARSPAIDAAVADGAPGSATKPVRSRVTG